MREIEQDPPPPGLLAATVARHGRLAVTGVSALAWALPAMAWAGTVDLPPYDSSPMPRAWAIAAAVAFAAWTAFALRVARIPDRAPRPRRLDASAMTPTERLWSALTALALVLWMGWLSAIATVGPAAPLAAAASGRPAVAAFGIAFLLPGAVLPLLAAGAARRWERAFRERRARALRP